MLCWKSGPYLKIKLRPYAFDIFTNSRLIIYMTLKAIVATKIVEYKKRGINPIREIAKEIGLALGKAERTLKQGVTKTLETCTL